MHKSRSAVGNGTTDFVSLLYNLLVVSVNVHYQLLLDTPGLSSPCHCMSISSKRQCSKDIM